MGKDIPLGRIAGIRIGFSSSALVIAALYTFLLATNRFPADAPFHSALARAPDGREGVLSFMEKRKARFAGRPSTDMPSNYPWGEKNG